MVLILVGFFIIIGIIVLQDSEVQYYLNDYKSMEDDLVTTKLKLNALKVVITFFAVCINFCYMIISYIVVSKARRFMLNDSSNQFHVNNPGESKYVYVQP
uniref:Uncharacterized protein n=1 Tax=Panagrolaimus davidi TaxID=227884 RepID=A0A914PVX3_9BILA